MNTVTVSSKFQVVIPRDLRRLLNIQPGQKLKARVQDDRSYSPWTAHDGCARRNRYPGWREGNRACRAYPPGKFMAQGKLHCGLRTPTSKATRA